MPAGLFCGFFGVLSELESPASSGDSNMALACSFLRNLKGVVDGPADGMALDVDGASVTRPFALLIMAHVRRPIRAGGGGGADSKAAATVGMIKADGADGLEGGIGMGGTSLTSGSSIVTKFNVGCRGIHLCRYNHAPS